MFYSLFVVNILARKSRARGRGLKQQTKKDEKETQLMLENLSAFDDLQSLVDSLLLDVEENQEESFLIFLRLSPIPKYLVKGYDFKMLNKYVFS